MVLLLNIKMSYNRYWFECNCIACCQDWPTWTQMKTNTSLRIRCTNCQNAITVPTDFKEFFAHCAVCLKTTNLLAALKVLQVSNSLNLENVLLIKFVFLILGYGK